MRSTANFRLISLISNRLRLLHLYGIRVSEEKPMDGHIHNPTELAAPTETDARLARESVGRLARQLAKADGSMQLRVTDPDGTSEAVEIPIAAFRLLVTILAEMASGNAVP